MCLFLQIHGARVIALCFCLHCTMQNILHTQPNSIPERSQQHHTVPFSNVQLNEIENEHRERCITINLMRFAIEPIYSEYPFLVYTCTRRSLTCGHFFVVNHIELLQTSFSLANHYFGRITAYTQRFCFCLLELHWMQFLSVPPPCTDTRAHSECGFGVDFLLRTNDYKIIIFVYGYRLLFLFIFFIEFIDARISLELQAVEAVRSAHSVRAYHIETLSFSSINFSPFSFPLPT